MVIELATFVAGPSAGLALAQLGATVVRMDPLGGAVDVNRWPLAPNGRSLYWSALNRGKHSVTLDLHSEKGREVALRLICAPGSDRAERKAAPGWPWPKTWSQGTSTVARESISAEVLNISWKTVRPATTL